MCRVAGTAVRLEHAVRERVGGSEREVRLRLGVRHVGIRIGRRLRRDDVLPRAVESVTLLEVEAIHLTVVVREIVRIVEVSDVVSVFERDGRQRDGRAVVGLTAGDRVSPREAVEEVIEAAVLLDDDDDVLDRARRRERGNRRRRARARRGWDRRASRTSREREKGGRRQLL